MRDRRWDAPTPRASRGGDDEDPVGGLDRLNMREWEEEQTQLDRDWYMANEDGTLVSGVSIGLAGSDKGGCRWETRNTIRWLNGRTLKQRSKPKLRQSKWYVQDFTLRKELTSFQKKVSAKQAQYVSTISLSPFSSTKVHPRMPTMTFGKPIDCSHPE